VKCLFPAWKVLLLTWGISGILSCHRFLAYEYFVINKDYNNGSEIIGNSSELRSLGDGDSNDSSAIIYHASVCRKVGKERELVPRIGKSHCERIS